MQKKVYDSFVDKFINASKKVKVGNGLEPGTTMGPLAHDRRVAAMEDFVSDAVEKGAEVETGGGAQGQGLFLGANGPDPRVPKQPRHERGALRTRVGDGAFR